MDDDINDAINNAKGVPEDAIDKIAKVENLVDREKLIEELHKETKAPKGSIRAELKRRAQTAAETTDRNSLPPEPEPWPHRVDGADLLDDLVEAHRRHLILPKGATEATALWELFAHAHDCFDISPLLAAVSPAPECGKTTFAATVMKLVPRPLPGSNFSTAVIYRSVDQWSPTLIIDEGDTYLRENPEMRGILDSGHNREMAWVLRAEGDNFSPTRYSTWAPKVVALLGRLHPTLSSRSIHIELKRKMPTEVVDPLRNAAAKAHLLTLRRKAMRWATDNDGRLRGCDPSIPDFLHGRAADNWRPLLAVADIAGGEWPRKAREVAAIFVTKKTDEVYGIMLLEDIQAILSAYAEPPAAIPGEDIVAELVKMDARPWPEWGKTDKPITKAQLAKLLGLFELEPKQIWTGGKNLRGYDTKALQEVFARYISSISGDTPSQTARVLDALPSKELRGNRSARAEKVLADEIDSKPLSGNGSSTLAVQKGVGGEKQENDRDPFAPLKDPELKLSFEHQLALEQAAEWAELDVPPELDRRRTKREESTEEEDHDN